MLLKLYPRDSIRQTGHGQATWYKGEKSHLYYIYNGKSIVYFEIWVNNFVVCGVEQKPLQYFDLKLSNLDEHFIKGTAIKGTNIKPGNAVLEEMVLVPFACEGLSPRLAAAFKSTIVSGHGGPLKQLPNLEGHHIKKSILLLPDSRFSTRNLLKDSRVQMLILVFVVILWIIILIFAFLFYFQYKKNQIYIPWIKL